MSIGNLWTTLIDGVMANLYIFHKIQLTLLVLSFCTHCLLLVLQVLGLGAVTDETKMFEISE